jgi:hypothetical protein
VASPTDTPRAAGLDLKSRCDSRAASSGLSLLHAFVDEPELPRSGEFE